MLPKRFRLKNRKAFDATYKQRKIAGNRLLTVYCGKKKADETQQTKIGFVVSKKFHKRAVKRNKIKRLIRESCRLLIKNGQFPQNNLSLVFLPKQEALGADFHAVYQAVSHICKKIEKI